MGKFDGKVVIITGASSGIGKSTAIAFAKEGANVAIAGRNKKRLADVAEECSKAEVEVLQLLGDLLEITSLEKIISKTVEKFGAIDILVNNAGTGTTGPVEQLQLKDYETVMNLNVRAPIFLCKYALPHLRKTKGCIVNVSSVFGKISSPGIVTYCVSKAALDHFMRGFASGGSSGIGESTAIAFAKEGANLTITGRNEERLRSVAEKCRNIGAKVLDLICNMGEFDALTLIISKTVETFGAIDVLVNNAATVQVGHFEQVDLQEYNRVVQLNLRAPMFLTKYALPHLRKTEGCIVNVPSASSLACHPGIILYSATKAALDHFTRGIALECAKDKVRINCVNPGVVPTRIFDGILSDEETEAARREALTRQPLCVLRGDDIANGIMYLCEAKGVTGTTLVIDGGLLLH